MQLKKIIIAGGCFWGVEAYYKRLRGVLLTRAGYTDGPGENPSYADVSRASGHVEAVYIEYDENTITQRQLLDHFLRIVDPTLANRQGGDIGIQYRTAVFLYDEGDYAAAVEYLTQAQSRYSRKIQTAIKHAGSFYEAETYHQDYLGKNPSGYCHINLHLAKPDELKEEYHV